MSSHSKTDPIFEFEGIKPIVGEISGAHKPAKHARGWRVRILLTDDSFADRYRPTKGEATKLMEAAQRAVPPVGSIAGVDPGQPDEVFWPALLRQLAVEICGTPNGGKREKLEATMRSLSSGAGAANRWAEMSRLKRELANLTEQYDNLLAERRAEQTLG